MFKNPAFYKSLANQCYMQVRKINYLNLIVKTKEKQEARSARVKKVFTVVYRDTHGQVFLLETMVQHKTLGYITFNQS